MLRSVVPANPAAFLNKSDSQRKRFGGYIPIGKSPEHGFIFFILFLSKVAEVTVYTVSEISPKCSNAYSDKMQGGP